MESARPGCAADGGCKQRARRWAYRWPGCRKHSSVAVFEKMMFFRVRMYRSMASIAAMLVSLSVFAH
eukprot:11156469-Alexandrium_andersonii.AAC.1